MYSEPSVLDNCLLFTVAEFAVRIFRERVALWVRRSDTSRMAVRGVVTLFTVYCRRVHCSLSMRWGSVWCGAAGVTLVAGGRGGGCDVAEGGSVCVCVCVCVEVCVPFNVRSGRLVTVCVIVNVNILDYALQLGRRCVVRKHRHVGAVAAELLAAFKLPCRKDTGKHACEDGKGGWAACKTLKSDLDF